MTQLVNMFAWPHGSDKRYGPTVEFRCLGDKLCLPLTPPASDDADHKAGTSNYAGPYRLKVGRLKAGRGCGRLCPS